MVNLFACPTIVRKPRIAVYVFVYVICALDALIGRILDVSLDADAPDAF